jgi:hypothetical protein
MVIASDDAVESRLAMLGRFDDAGMDQRLARFRGRLHELHDDPVEAARIDALVTEAEREEQGEQATDAASGSRLTIHVNGGVANVSHGETDQAAGARDGTDDRLAALEAETLRLRHRLEAIREDNAPYRTRARRTWEALLAPAFGGGVLVTVLAAATVITVLHAPVAAMTVIAAVLAVATAVAASLSVWMPWSSVRALNRRGHAHIALELLSHGASLQEARQQREQAEMLRQFALEDREAQWARQDRNAELERQRAERERERSQYEIEHREAMQRHRDELDARIWAVQMLAERGLLDSDSDLISDLVRRIGGEESSSPSRDVPVGLTAPAEQQ